jgi:hypothetical protein
MHFGGEAISASLAEGLRVAAPERSGGEVTEVCNDRRSRIANDRLTIPAANVLPATS